MNSYEYVSSNPVFWFDVFGLWKSIVINEGGTRNGKTYGATVTLTTNSGKVVIVKGSTFSNPKSFYKYSKKKPPVSGVEGGKFSGEARVKDKETRILIDDNDALWTLNLEKKVSGLTFDNSQLHN